MWALLCLGIWSELGYVKDKDVKAATVLPEVDSDDEDELDDNWDAIYIGTLDSFFFMSPSHLM